MVGDEGTVEWSDDDAVKSGSNTGNTIPWCRGQRVGKWQDNSGNLALIQVENSLGQGTEGGEVVG